MHIYDRLTSLCEYFYSFLHSVITSVFVFWSGVNVFRGHDGLKIKICIFISVPNCVKCQTDALLSFV